MGAELFDKKSLQTEEIDTNRQRVKFVIGPERFREGVVYAYNKTRSRFNIPGFRKGKAPRQIIEMQYGKEIFYHDAVEYLLDAAFESVIDESGLDVVGTPEADVDDISTKDGVAFTIYLYTRPIAKVSKYKGLAYNEIAVTVTDAEVDERIEQTRDRNSRLVSLSDHPAEIDDIVTLDYQGSMNGVMISGGTSESYDLTLGSGTFIEEFENQLIGARIGEERDVYVTFPDDYHVSEIAGKPAVFKCVIKYIRRKELPELNDDFAQDVSEFDTFAEYRDSVAAEIKREKSEAAKRDKENRLIEMLIKETDVEIPPVMIEQEMDQLADDIKTHIESSGMSFDYYLQYSGQTDAQVREKTREAAIDNVKARLALETIALKEQLTVSDEELDAEIIRISEIYKMQPNDLRSVFGEKGLERLAADLKVQKAADLVVETAVTEVPYT